MFRIVIISLLLGAGVAYAAPPSTPTLDIQVEGQKAEAKWSAVGATGYRLFYAPHSDVKNLTTVDMGTETQLSNVLAPGTAMYMAVQAYNDDGDSTPSEFKFFMIPDPDAEEANSANDTAAESHPTAIEGLEFKTVSLDTPVAFVPTVEDSQIQERVIQSQQDNATYDAAFDEGKISMTLEIAPTGVKRESLELLFCLGDENGCDPLIIWNNQPPKGFVKTITILDLPDDVEKSVYVDLLMPASLAEKLRGQPNGEPHEYTIYAHDVNSTGANDKLVPVTKIQVVNLGERENEQTNAETAATSPETEAVTEEAGTEEAGTEGAGGEPRAALRDAVYNPANGHYYRLVNYGVSYYEAARAAKISSYNNLRGSLMVISDPAERTFIQTNSKKLGFEKWGIYWIWDGNTTNTSTGMTLGGPGYNYSETSKDASAKLGGYVIEYAPSTAKLHDPVYNSANKHYYQVVDDQTNFYDAFQVAATSSYQNLPGSLLVINDAAERTFVQNNLSLEQWGIYWISNSSGASTSLGGSGYNYKEQAYAGSKVLGNYIVEYGATPPTTGSTSGSSTGGTSSGTTGSTAGSTTGSTSITDILATAKEQEKKPKLITCKVTGRELTKAEKEQVVKQGGDISSDFTGVRCYKEFGKNFSSKAAGVRFAMKPNVWIYKLVPPPNLNKNSTTSTPATKQKKKTEYGARIGVIGEVKATIVGFTVDVVAIDLGLLKNRGRKATRSGDLYILGVKVETYGQARVPGGWQSCQLSGSNCSTAPVNESDNGLLDGDAEDVDEVPASQQVREAKNLVNYTRTVKSEYKQVFVIGFIPVEAKAGVYGTVNIGVGFAITNVDITTDTDTMGLDVTLLGGPGANLTVGASAGVTILIATVGVEVKLTLIEDELVFSVTTKLRKNFRIGGKIENLLQGPYGSLILFVEWYQPAFSIPPWEQKRKEKTLASWDSGLKNTYTLFSWGDNGDEVKGANSSDIKGGGTPSRVDYVPIVVDKEPVAGIAIDGQSYSPSSWVCFYQYENFQGTPACIEMPTEYQEVGFDVMTFDKKDVKWNDRIKSIKIWGPLRVGVFEHTLSEDNDEWGSSAYWYAHEGQMEYVNYVGVSFDNPNTNPPTGITGVLMTKITEQSAHPFKRPSGNDFPEVCFYWNDDLTGDYYCYHSGSASNRGGFDAVWETKTGTLAGDVRGTTKNNKNDWRNEVASFSLQGDGPYMLCLYDNTQADNPLDGYVWKENGDNSCFMRARMRYSSEGVNLIGMKNRMNDFYLMQDVGLALISDFSSTLQEAGTSSLPNSDKMIARGRLDAIYRRTGRGDANMIYHSDSASIVFVTGPITVRLYKYRDQKGTNSTFYLDEGEWDVAYLNGIDNETVTYTFWDAKLAGTYRNK